MVLALRSDFLGKCAYYADLNTFIGDHFIQIEPMGGENLRSAIVEPARLVQNIPQVIDCLLKAGFIE